MSAPYVYTLPTVGINRFPPTSGVYRPSPLIANYSTNVVSDPYFIQHLRPWLFILISAIDFGGAAVTVEISPDGVTAWQPLNYNGQPLVVTAPMNGVIPKLITSYIRASITGATESTDNIGVFIGG